MGYECVWEAESAKVHFRNPSETEKLADAEYKPQRWIMEFYDTELPGLYEASISDDLPEITIAGDAYIVKSAEKLADGHTVKAYLEKV